jgi:hypothetical protein
MDYYSTNFTLINKYNWSNESIENLIPWERDVYINLLIAYEDTKQQKQMQSNGMKDFNFYG